MLKNRLEAGASKILIFSQTRNGCDQLSSDINSEGFNSLSIHGEKRQQERD